MVNDNPPHSPTRHSPVSAKRHSPLIYYCLVKFIDRADSVVAKGASFLVVPEIVMVLPLMVPVPFVVTERVLPLKSSLRVFSSNVKAFPSTTAVIIAPYASSGVKVNLFEVFAVLVTAIAIGTSGSLPAPETPDSALTLPFQAPKNCPRTAGASFSFLSHAIRRQKAKLNKSKAIIFTFFIICNLSVKSSQKP